MQNYVYQSVLQTLTFCSRPQFLQDCNSWKGRKVSTDGAMSDIYDGMVWRNLHECDGTPYLSLPNNLFLALNIILTNRHHIQQELCIFHY